MRRHSHLINYDFEHDTFYRVDQLGHHNHTYINGEPLKHFRPNVTGLNYLIRKVYLLISRPLILEKIQIGSDR